MSRACGPLHTLIEVQGEARIVVAPDRVIPALKGSRVENGQTIQIGQGGAVSILCANGYPVHVTAGSHRLNCPSTHPTFVVDGVRIAGLKAMQPDRPYTVVRSPRRSALRDPRPSFRWTLPPDAPANAPCELLLLSGSEQIWRRRAIGTTMAFPTDVPDLEPNRIYRLVVEYNGRASSEERTPDLGFWVVPAAARVEIGRRLSTLDGLNVTPDVRGLLQARLLAGSRHLPDGTPGGHGFYSESLELLSHAALPASLEFLGETYLRVGLIDVGLATLARARDRYAALSDPHNAARVAASLKALIDDEETSK